VKAAHATIKGFMAMRVIRISSSAGASASSRVRGVLREWPEKG
jgi:hypothetical protein